MSVIIRLQQLPWSASAGDVRSFFAGLSIPEGGVHIVGGRDGDAFIAFTSDEDARQAMRQDGRRIQDARIKLLLSSRLEMQKVIDRAKGDLLDPPSPIVSPRKAPSPPPPSQTNTNTVSGYGSYPTAEAPWPAPTPKANPWGALDRGAAYSGKGDSDTRAPSSSSLSSSIPSSRPTPIPSSAKSRERLAAEILEREGLEDPEPYQPPSHYQPPAPPRGPRKEHYQPQRVESHQPAYPDPRPIPKYGQPESYQPAAAEPRQPAYSAAPVPRQQVYSAAPVARQQDYSAAPVPTPRQPVYPVAPVTRQQGYAEQRTDPRQQNYPEQQQRNGYYEERTWQERSEAAPKPEPRRENPAPPESDARNFGRDRYPDTSRGPPPFDGIQSRPRQFQEEDRRQPIPDRRSAVIGERQPSGPPAAMTNQREPRFRENERSYERPKLGTNYATEPPAPQAQPSAFPNFSIPPPTLNLSQPPPQVLKAPLVQTPVHQPPPVQPPPPEKRSGRSLLPLPPPQPAPPPAPLFPQPSFSGPGNGDWAEPVSKRSRVLQPSAALGDMWTRQPLVPKVPDGSWDRPSESWKSHKPPPDPHPRDEKGGRPPGLMDIRPGEPPGPSRFRGPPPPPRPPIPPSGPPPSFFGGPGRGGPGPGYGPRFGGPPPGTTPGQY